MRTKRHVVYRTETRQDRQNATRRTNTERRRRDKQKRRERQQTAWRLQKRFDKERDDGEAPLEKDIKEDQYVVDHICYTTETTVGVRWIGGEITEELLKDFKKDAKEAYVEYERKGKITEKEYLIYLKFRDSFKHERRRRRGEPEERSDDSSDVRTSEIESD